MSMIAASNRRTDMAAASDAGRDLQLHRVAGGRSADGTEPLTKQHLWPTGDASEGSSVNTESRESAPMFRKDMLQRLPNSLDSHGHVLPKECGMQLESAR
jgi:hypothetical protein